MGRRTRSRSAYFNAAFQTFFYLLLDRRGIFGTQTADKLYTFSLLIGLSCTFTVNMPSEACAVWDVAEHCTVWPQSKFAGTNASGNPHISPSPSSCVDACVNVSSWMARLISSQLSLIDNHKEKFLTSSCHSGCSQVPNLYRGSIINFVTQICECNGDQSHLGHQGKT